MDVLFAFGFRGRARRLALTALAAAISLQGCSESIGLSPNAVNKDDSCSSFRGVIAQARQTEIQQQQQAAVAGAVIGALFGGLMAGSDNRAEGVLAGAAIGGLVGLSATYYQQKAQLAADNDALLSSVNSDAGTEHQLVTKTGRAAAELRECRSAQIADLADRVRNGQVEKDMARAELRTIEARVIDDNQIVSAAFNGISERVMAYVDAKEQVAAADATITLASAQAATPNVSLVEAERVKHVNDDTLSRQRLEDDIEGLQVLLG